MGGPQLAGLVLAVAVRNNVIRVTLERAAGELPVHPRVERVVHEQVSQQRRNWGTLRVPFSLGTMVPSGIRIGAFSHREMYSRTHRSLVW